VSGLKTTTYLYQKLSENNKHNLMVQIKQHSMQSLMATAQTGYVRFQQSKRYDDWCSNTMCLDNRIGGQRGDSASDG